MKSDIDTMPRWDARIILYDGEELLEEIFLYGILATTRGSASNMAWERAWAVLDKEYDTVAAGLKIVSLEEHVVNGSPIDLTVPKGVTHHAYRPAKPYTPPKPFKCPIVALCGTRKVGRLVGTTMTVSTVPDTEEV